MPRGIYDRTKSKFNKASFKKGHIPWSKLHPELMPKGKEAGAWKGGRIKHNKGYILILKHKHPFGDHHGYVFEHRLVIEKQIGRYLTSKEQVHHLGERDDNRPKMLMAFSSNSAHTRFERGKKIKSSEIIFDGRKLNERDITKTSEKLKAVLCNPDGVVCCSGSNKDRKMIKEAIVEVEKLEKKIKRIEKLADEKEINKILRTVSGSECWIGMINGGRIATVLSTYIKEALCL